MSAFRRLQMNAANLLGLCEAERVVDVTFLKHIELSRFVLFLFVSLGIIKDSRKTS
jgi:hypothetical protein